MKDIKAKKSLGQNFLKNKKVLEKIVEISEIKKGEIVLEVGPGKGALTEKILNAGAKVIAIEKDSRMIPYLEQKFAPQISAGNLEIFEDDALFLDYQKINLSQKKFKIIANLPYYITGKFLSNVLSAKKKPEILVLMLQKAVVERISPQKKNKNFKQNLLSLSVSVFGKPEFIMPVSAKNFTPAPKVDSAVLKVSEISDKFFTGNKIDQDNFFIFLKNSFSGKRKKIIKNLKEKSEIKRDFLEKIFDELEISKDVRAEDLKLSDFKKIFKKIF